MWREPPLVGRSRPRLARLDRRSSRLEQGRALSRLAVQPAHAPSSRSLALAPRRHLARLVVRPATTVIASPLDQGPALQTGPPRAGLDSHAHACAISPAPSARAFPSPTSPDLVPRPSPAFTPRLVFPGQHLLPDQLGTAMSSSVTAKVTASASSSSVSTSPPPAPRLGTPCPPEHHLLDLSLEPKADSQHLAPQPSSARPSPPSPRRSAQLLRRALTRPPSLTRHSALLSPSMRPSASFPAP